MKNAVRQMVALVIVTGALTFNAKAADSLAVNNHCKVFSLKDARKVRMVYATKTTEPTFVKIVNQDNEEIYSERVGEGGFVKDYNFDFAPDGYYTFEVRSADFTHEQTVSLADGATEVVTESLDLSKAQFVLTTIEGKPALLGRNASGANLRYVILDESGDRLHKVDVANDEEIRTIFTFDRVRDDELTFQFFIDGELIRERSIKI